MKKIYKIFPEIEESIVKEFCFKNICPKCGALFEYPCSENRREAIEYVHKERFLLEYNLPMKHYPFKLKRVKQ